MDADLDHYEAFYTEKLWQLLPELYRSQDSTDVDRAGPLRELVARVGVQAAILRRSMDRLWEDQSIETCDDWVVPYIGELLASNPVPSLDARGRRIDVAKTIFYRRRKGTLAVLEVLAHDITAWDIKVGEFFRRLARARHAIDPAIGRPEAEPDPSGARRLQVAQHLVGMLTGTPAGGLANLRSRRIPKLVRGAFDELSYTLDARSGRRGLGYHNIRHLGVFGYSTFSNPVTQATPVRDVTCTRQFTFDPTGRDIPLFAASATDYTDAATSPLDWQVPGPIDRHLLRERFGELYASLDGTEFAPHSLALWVGATPTLVSAQTVTADARAVLAPPAPTRYLVVPERGRLHVSDAVSAADVDSLLVSYQYGSGSLLGAGAYERGSHGDATGLTAATAVTGGGLALDAALSVAGDELHLRIEDSRTYTRAPDLTVQSLAIVALNQCRPVIRLPEATPATTWQLTGKPEANDGAGAKLILDGVLVSGGEILLSGRFDSITLHTTTLDPGEPSPDLQGLASAADGRPLLPCKLRIAGVVKRLTIARSIVGSIVLEGAGAVERIAIEDSIVQGLGDAPAIAAATALVDLQRCSVLGDVQAHGLEVSNCILHGRVGVADRQQGCIRFSAFTAGGVVPRTYETLRIAPGASPFRSRRFARPEYAQLAANADRTIVDANPARTLGEGAEDGSEMGAFSREKRAIKQRSILIRYDEYMPIGLRPVLIRAT